MTPATKRAGFLGPGVQSPPRDVGEWLAIGLVYAALGLFVLYPLALVLGLAIKEEGAAAAVQELLTDDDILIALVNTLTTSAIGVGVAGFFGVLLGWLIGRTNIPFKRALDPLNLVPFYLSSVVGALSWQVIASPRRGLLNVLLEPLFGPATFNIYSVGGIGFVLGLYFTPFVYLLTLSSLQSMDASLEEASRASGGTVLETALRITLPLSGPAILSAWLLVFVTCMGTFGVPLVLGVPGHIHTLPTLMYSFINDYPANYSVAAAVGCGLLLITLALTALQMLALKGRKFTTVTGKGYKPRELDLGGWKWAALAVNALYLLLVLGPFVVLLLVSLQDAWTGAFEWSRLTLRNYHQVLFVDVTAKRGLVNSLITGSIGATLTVFLCLMLALLVRRTRLPLRGGIYPITMIPVAVPGVVLGVGVLLAAIGTPLYGTLWIIVIAYVVEYLPTGVRNMDSLVQSVSNELDESARVSGASWWRAMTQIILPLHLTGIVSAWILMFVTFVREVSASMMLFTYGTETMSIALIRIMEVEPYGVSGAFGILQTLLLLVCVAVLRALPLRQTS